MPDIWINILGDASKLKSALGEANKNVNNFSEKIGKIGKIATVAGTAITAAFTAIVTKTAQVGDQFDKMSLRTGVTVEDLSSLAYAADICGTDIGTVENSLRFLASGMKDTVDGTGTAKDAFAELGISVLDSNGKLRSTVDVMKEAATKLAEMDDKTRQAALAGEIFGTRYGTQLLPLLKESGGGIEELMNKAKDLGITMSTETATKAAEFTDRMTDLKGSLAGAGRTIGDTLIPAIIPLVEKVTEIISKVAEWARENPKLVSTITKVAAVIGGLAAVGGPILMAVSAFTKISGAVTAIGTLSTGPIGLLILAIAGVVLAFKNWDKIVTFVKGFVNTLKSIFSGLSNMMFEWGKNAIGGFIEGIKSKIDSLTGAIKNVGTKIKNLLGFKSPPREGPLADSDEWMPNMMKMFREGISDNQAEVLEPIDTMAKNLASAIANVKMKFYPAIKELKETISSLFGMTGSTGHALKAYYKAQLEDLTNRMNEQIQNLKYGYRVYQNVLESLGGSTSEITSYQTGTSYVPKTQLALVHQGEEINPPGQRSYDQRKSNYTTSINIEPGAIVIQTPKFNEQDGEKIFDMIEKKAKQRGLVFARG